MQRSRFRGVGVLVLISAGLCAATAAPLDNSRRPAADVARDANRKPAEMVKFAKIKAGETVVDFIPGNGYFTRVFAQAVGPSGKVVAVVPNDLAARKPEVVTALRSIVTDEGYANIEVVVRAPSDIAPPASADVVWTAQNYHDFHLAKNPPDTAAMVNKSAFSALKPGGRYMVIEHRAVAGSGARDADTLHRIDTQMIKDEVKAAGFVLEEQSEILANPDDDRSKSVFAPEIRGKTDQVALRFVKPKK